MADFAGRLGGIAPFKAMKVLDRANQLQAEGRKIIHLEVGEPDFPTPAPIVQAAKVAMDDGKTKYTPAPGIFELREAISQQYQTNYGLEVDPGRIFVTAGGSGALLLAMALTIDPGTGLLMSDPGYPCNRNFVQSFNGEAHLVPVNAQDNYQLTERLVKEHWRPNTRAALLASPANPTGSVISRDELLGISSAVNDQNGFLIMDEIYHGLHYGPDYPVSGLEFDAIVVNSFSKYYGMTGWRLGWLVVPKDASANVEKLAQNLFICPSAISQHAALAAFSQEAQNIMQEQRQAFMQRRDLLVAGLRDLGFGVPVCPEGAFYVYAELPGSVSVDSEAFCSMLLEDYGVAVTAGPDFGEYEADRHIRVSYANDLEALKQALESMAEALR